MSLVVRFFAAAALAALIPAGGAAAGVAEPPERPALAARDAAHAVLLSAALAGKRLVAVGERGIVLLSDDGGKAWRQARVPVSVTLTAVAFPTPMRGWAVGHYGIVLHSEDGGETWTRQLDGVTAARLVLDAAQAAAGAARPDDAGVQRRLAEARQLAKDGPDKPFLDLYFENEQRGFIVGAYNLMFGTEDGGRSWRYLGDRLDNPKGNHIYAIRAVGSDVYLAGEQGLALRSGDGGRSFARLNTPYQGSYFALAALAGGEVVLAGLRGNAYHSADRGASWQKIEVPAPVSFSAVAVAGDGSLLLANQAGQLFRSGDRGRTLQPLPAPPLPPVNGLAPLPDGSLLLVGLRGIVQLPAAPGGR